MGRELIAAAYTALLGLFPSRQPELDVSYAASVAALGEGGGQSQAEASRHAARSAGTQCTRRRALRAEQPPAT